jgi:hypothetical protein
MRILMDAGVKFNEPQRTVNAASPSGGGGSSSSSSSHHPHHLTARTSSDGGYAMHSAASRLLRELDSASLMDPHRVFRALAAEAVRTASSTQTSPAGSPAAGGGGGGSVSALDVFLVGDALTYLHMRDLAVPNFRRVVLTHMGVASGAWAGGKAGRQAGGALLLSGVACVGECVAWVVSRL